MDSTKSCPVESYSRDPKLRPERLCPQSDAIGGRGISKVSHEEAAR